MTFKWLPPKPFKQLSWKVWKIIPRDPRVPERGHTIVATNGGRDWLPCGPTHDSMTRFKASAARIRKKSPRFFPA